jgi:hypothetical protein
VLHTGPGPTEYEYRYQVTRNGRRVGRVEAEFHGRAVWEIDDPAFVDPGEPCTIERLDAAIYAAGLEVVPDE